MSKNFSAPRSNPKPASVTTQSARWSAVLGRDDAVTSVGDVRERPTVDERRHAFECLHQVRVHRVAQQSEHGAGDVELVGGDWLFVAGKAHERPVESLSQIILGLGETEDRHDFGRGGDVESGFARNTLEGPAEADDDVSQRAIVHVDDPSPKRPSGVHAERVSKMNVVVERCREKIVRRGDGVEVAGEVQVDALHRIHLAQTAAGRTSLDPHARSERRLTKSETHGFVQLVEALSEPDAGRGFTFASRRGCDRRDQDQLGALVSGRFVENGHVHLGDVSSVRLPLLGGEP